MKLFIILLLAVSAQGSELISAKEASKEAHKVQADHRSECLKEWSDDISEKIGKAAEDGKCEEFVFMAPGGCVTKKAIKNEIKTLKKLGYTVIQYEPYGEQYNVQWCTD